MVKHDKSQHVTPRRFLPIPESEWKRFELLEETLKRKTGLTTLQHRQAFALILTAAERVILEKSLNTKGKESLDIAPMVQRSSVHLPNVLRDVFLESATA